MEINDKNQPLVTVITPLYNAQEYIAQTIESVISQTYQNWEMIIVDDCSTDSSRDVVSRYVSKDERIKLIQSESNFGGPARPRNIALKNSKGDFVAFLDADDIWLPQKLEKQINFLKQNNNVDICHTLANTIDENGISKNFIHESTTYKKLKNVISKKNIIYYINFININSVLMKFDSELKFEEDINLIALEDWKYWIDNIKKNKTIVLIDELLISYRVSDSSLSNRNTDTGYRKAIYLLSLMLLKKEINKKHFFFSILLNLLKINRKNA